MDFKMVGIVDVDLLSENKKRFPNLASMKISAFCKSKGEETRLILTPLEAAACGKIYASKVFTDTPEPGWLSLMGDKVSKGGTGYFFDKAQPLPEEIEHIKPDYSLYLPVADSLKLSGEAEIAFRNASIGFTTRGCFRQCPFCVNQKYKRVFRHSPVVEFLDETKKYIILLDDNIFGFAYWREVFAELMDTGKPFVFKQGLDMRLMSRDKAATLQAAKYHREIIFALDNLDEIKLFEGKAQIFREFCDKPAKSYVLTGFYEKDEAAFLSALLRVETLSKYKILPYIMRFKDCYTSPFDSLFSTLAAWANQPAFYKKTSFVEFCKKCGRRPCEQLEKIKDRDTLELMNRHFCDV